MTLPRHARARTRPAASLAVLPLGLAAALLLTAATGESAGTQAPAAQGGPTLATEDTMHTDVSPVLVKAPRVTLEEILDRVARGEARRDSLLRDQSFTATLRVMRNTGANKQPVLFAESVYKVYKKKPDMLRSIELRSYQEHPDKDDEKPEFDDDFSPGMGEEIVNFAFRPANRKNFRFTIEDRKLLGDHLLYTLRFEPRSALAAYEPAGRVWVDTKEFVIVRQEIEFKQSPVPLILKDISRMVVERERSGDFWVLSRAMIRMELTIPIPKFGRSFDFAIALTDYTLNSDLPDSLFAGSGKHGDGRARVRAGPGRKHS